MISQTPTITTIITAANAAYQHYTDLVESGKVDRQAAAKAALQTYLEKVKA